MLGAGSEKKSDDEIEQATDWAELVARITLDALCLLNNRPPLESSLGGSSSGRK